jgi:hypothetical protein
MKPTNIPTTEDAPRLALAPGVEIFPPSELDRNGREERERRRAAAAAAAADEEFKTCDSKSPPLRHQDAVDELFNIHPMNFLRDVSTAKYHTLERVADHLKDLLQSVEIVKNFKRRSLQHPEEKEENIEELIPSSSIKPCCGGLSMMTQSSEPTQNSTTTREP